MADDGEPLEGVVEDQVMYRKIKRDDYGFKALLSHTTSGVGALVLEAARAGQVSSN